MSFPKTYFCNLYSNIILSFLKLLSERLSETNYFQDTGIFSEHLDAEPRNDLSTSMEVPPVANFSSGDNVESIISSITQDVEMETVPEEATNSGSVPSRETVSSGSVPSRETVSSGDTLSTDSMCKWLNEGRGSEFTDRLRKLNESFLQLMELYIERDVAFDFRPVFDDYKRRLDFLKEEYPKRVFTTTLNTETGVFTSDDGELFTFGEKFVVPRS